MNTRKTATRRKVYGRIDDVNGFCKACGDPASHQIKKQPYCLECFEELTDGTIGKPPKPTLQSLGSHLTYRQALALPKTSS